MYMSRARRPGQRGRWSWQEQTRGAGGPRGLDGGLHVQLSAGCTWTAGGGDETWRRHRPPSRLTQTPGPGPVRCLRHEADVARALSCQEEGETLDNSR